MFHLARNVTDQEWQLRWAAAMSGVAEEFTAELKNLPPEERELAARRANSLSQVANQLVSGKVPPRLRPGAPIPI